MRLFESITLLSLLVPAVAFGQTITSSTESTPYPGVRVVEGRTSGPGTNFYAAYVSLCSDHVHVDASAYGTSRSSASWGASVGAQLAVNGDFFTGTPRTHVYGDVVSGGQRWALNRTGLHSDYAGDWYYNRYGWIAFGDGWVDFTNTEWIKQNNRSSSGWAPDAVAPEPRPGTRALLSGFPQLVYDGTPITCSSATATSCFPDRTDMRARHPRTAMGLSEDRKTFMLVVVDGRSTSSAGMYGSELAKLMKDLGAHTAFNLDGGGSSQMWLQGGGTINRPSDGTPRAVVNHWGVFAGAGSGKPMQPGHCDPGADALVHALGGQLQRAGDLDGDGRGDACIRTAAGVECALSTAQGFSDPIAGPPLSDDLGWGDMSNYATMRWGDIDGDGRADLCARANAGIRCWRFDGEAFGDAIAGPELSDAAGWDEVSRYSTIRLADFDGDGRDDLCARDATGMACYASSGTAFGAAVAGPALSDDSGWNDISNYATIRTGDVNGDGKDDICARANAGMHCWLSDGSRFAERIDGPAWSDAQGWDRAESWSTIRLVDLDDDGRSDLCGRAPSGVVCHLSTGSGFGPPIDGPALSDASGWDDASNYATLRFVDVTGDGLLDVCARAGDGMLCWPFDGTAFATDSFGGPARDASGWTAPRFYRTIDFVDFDDDGMADLCARAAAGLVCWRANGAGFDEELLSGPRWSDDAGFGAPAQYSTLTLLGRVRPPPDDPDVPVIPPAAGDAGGGESSDSGGRSPSQDAEAGPRVIDAEGGCGCASAPGGTDGGALIALLMVVAGRRRRRGGENRAPGTSWS